MAKKMRKCAWCGRLFVSKRATHIYCSQDCCQAATYSPKNTKKSRERSCPRNEHIICVEHNCDKCGWNPEVSKARLAAIIAKMKGAKL